MAHRGQLFLGLSGRPGQSPRAPAAPVVGKSAGGLVLFISYCMAPLPLTVLIILVQLGAVSSRLHVETPDGAGRGGFPAALPNLPSSGPLAPLFLTLSQRDRHHRPSPCKSSHNKPRATPWGPVGYRDPSPERAKHRRARVAPLQGSRSVGFFGPRALPWAGMLRPLGTLTK